VTKAMIVAFDQTRSHDEVEQAAPLAALAGLRALR
jgi:hypothetical protein